MPTVNELIEEKQVQELDKLAREVGFHSVIPGEVYETQLNRDVHVFIIKEEDKWSSWRETWKRKTTLSIAHKGLANQVPFEIALQQAKKYIESILRWRK